MTRFLSSIYVHRAEKTRVLSRRRSRRCRFLASLFAATTVFAHLGWHGFGDFMKLFRALQETNLLLDDIERRRDNCLALAFGTGVRGKHALKTYSRFNQHHQVGGSVVFALVLLVQAFDFPILETGCCWCWCRRKRNSDWVGWCNLVFVDIGLLLFVLFLLKKNTFNFDKQWLFLTQTPLTQLATCRSPLQLFANCSKVFMQYKRSRFVYRLYTGNQNDAESNVSGEHYSLNPLVCVLCRMVSIRCDKLTGRTRRWSTDW